MKRHIGSKVFDNPSAHLLDIFRIIIEGRDNEIGYFEPYAFFLQYSKRIEHRPETPAADPAVKIFCEAFEINISGIHEL